MTFFFLYVADVTVQKIRHLPIYYLFDDIPRTSYIYELSLDLDIS